MQITGSGSYDAGGGCTATLSGTRTYVSVFGGVSGSTFLDAEYGIDGSLLQGQLSILVAATAESGFFVRTYSGNCGDSPPDTIPVSSGVQDGAGSIPSGQSDNALIVNLPQALQLQLDSSYAIKGATKSSLPAPGVQGAGMVTYSWPAVPANAPPRDTDDAGK